MSISEARLVDFQRNCLSKFSRGNAGPEVPGSSCQQDNGQSGRFYFFPLAHAPKRRERFYPLEEALVKSVPRPRSSSPTRRAYCALTFHSGAPAVASERINAVLIGGERFVRSDLCPNFSFQFEYSLATILETSKRSSLFYLIR